MHNFLQNVLLQPFPTYKQHGKQLFVCFIAAATVFLMLYILEPFNINLLNAQQKLAYAYLYASITLYTCLFLTIICPLLFPSFFNESKWTVLKEVMYILLILIVISGINLIAHHIYDATPLTIITFLISLTYTLPLAAFPVSFSILIKQKWLKQKFKNEAILWNNLLKDYQNEIKINANASANIATINEESTFSALKNETNTNLIFSGTGVGEVIEVKLEDFLLVSSADNYITVYFLDNGNLKTILLRNTLKNAEIKTTDFEYIVRCHRSYIVNLKKMERIIGDAQGLKLLLYKIEFPIPVGKLYMQYVKQLLDTI